MGILAEKERPGDTTPGAILANRLGDGEDVCFGEGALEWGSAVTACPEADPLGRIFGIGLPLVVVTLQPRHVDQQLWWSGLAGEWMHSLRNRFGNWRRVLAVLPTS